MSATKKMQSHKYSVVGTMPSENNKGENSVSRVKKLFSFFHSPDDKQLEGVKTGTHAESGNRGRLSHNFDDFTE